MQKASYNVKAQTCTAFKLTHKTEAFVLGSSRRITKLLLKSYILKRNINIRKNKIALKN